jgi:catechol 2,3-dioxygenase-like lactoylglutathione lyase family enzyme
MGFPSGPPDVTHPEPAAHHYGVTVADLDRAVAFYEDAFGLDTLDRFTVSGEAFSTAVGVANATGRFAHLDADGTRLELVEYDPQGDAESATSVEQPGAKHLGLSVADLDRFYEGLAADIETISEPRTTDSGTRILFVRDLEGNLIEVLEA